MKVHKPRYRLGVDGKLNLSGVISVFEKGVYSHKDYEEAASLSLSASSMNLAYQVILLNHKLTHLTLINDKQLKENYSLKVRLRGVVRESDRAINRETIRSMRDMVAIVGSQSKQLSVVMVSDLIDYINQLEAKLNEGGAQ